MKFFKKLFDILNHIPFSLALLAMSLAIANLIIPTTGLLIWVWMFIVIEFIVGYERSKTWHRG